MVIHRFLINYVFSAWAITIQHQPQCKNTEIMTGKRNHFLCAMKCFSVYLNCTYTYSEFICDIYLMKNIRKSYEM